MRALSEHVTDEITFAVNRLRNLGVGKVLVNLLPPLGCIPWQSVANDYSSCEGQGNTLSSLHNKALRRKMERLNDVLVLDLYTVFDRFLDNLGMCVNTHSCMHPVLIS